MVMFARHPKNVHQPWPWPATRASTPIMPHPARHARHKTTHEEHQHAIGSSLLEEIGERRVPMHLRPAADHAEQRAEHAQQRPKATAPPVLLRQDGAHAPPSPLTPTTSRIHAASVGLLVEPKWGAQPERECGGHGGGDDNSTAAATAEDPKRALVRGPAATSRAAEDPQRALVHALQKDIRALKSDMSSRMSVLLERLDELL